MRVLVTGLSGFTGKYLKVELESHGHTVMGLQANLMDLNAISNELQSITVDAVIHLAGVSQVTGEDPNLIYQVNLIGTRNLLVALKPYVSAIKTVILTSSAYVYGSNTEGLLTEDAPVKPVNDYAVSKASMELLATLWMETYPITIVRPFNYTGVGQSDYFLIPKIVSHFKSKKPMIELGNLDVEREFGDVRSVVEIYRKLIENPPEGLTMNIATSQPHALMEVIQLCEQITGHSMEVKINPAFVRENEVSILYGSNARLKSWIEPWTQYNLEDTLTWMLSHEP